MAEMTEDEKEVSRLAKELKEVLGDYLALKNAEDVDYATQAGVRQINVSAIEEVWWSDAGAMQSCIASINTAVRQGLHQELIARKQTYRDVKKAFDDLIKDVVSSGN